MTLTVDRRLYLPHAVKEWTPRVMSGHSREYCHSKFADDPNYHLLVEGEVYLDNGAQKYCLECGLRMGLLTHDRMFWQKERAADVIPPKEGSADGRGGLD